MGRKNSTTSIGCHGHAGGTRPGQTRQTPKDLSAHESEERGHGESVGLYAVYMRERGGWGRGGSSEAPSDGARVFSSHFFSHCVW